MEFLNGLKTPLELFAGKVCQKAGRLVTLLAVVRVAPSPPRAKSRPLRQNAQDSGWWQCCSRTSAFIDYSYSPTHPYKRDFKREFLSAGSTLLLQGAWLMLNHFIGRQGKCSIDHGGTKSYPPCTLFCFSRLVFPLLPFSPE